MNEQLYAPSINSVFSLFEIFDLEVGFHLFMSKVVDVILIFLLVCLDVQASFTED